MTKIRSLAVSVLAAATLAAPAMAAPAAFYQAELAAPAESARIIAGGLLWNCEGTQCVAGEGTSRPVIVCRKLARETPEIVSFTADGKALPADKLARCNA